MCFCETETRQRTIRIRRRRRIPASAEPCANGIEVKLLSQHFSGQLNFNTQNNRSVAQSDAEITDKANKVKYSTYRKGFGKYCCDYFNTLTYGIPMLPHARLHGGDHDCQHVNWVIAQHPLTVRAWPPRQQPTTLCC